MARYKQTDRKPRLLAAVLSEQIGVFAQLR